MFPLQLLVITFIMSASAEVRAPHFDSLPLGDSFCTPQNITLFHIGPEITVIESIEKTSSTETAVK